MKKIILSIAAVIALNLYVKAQTPEKIQYQAVARNSSGTIIANQSVGFKISIIEGSSNGNVVYSETHNGFTNTFGLVNLQIGGGTVVSGSMASIDWSNGNHYIKIEMDATGGSNYQLMGTSQLLSVPYALHAKSADNTFSGDFNDLTNVPTIPSNTSDLNNDSGFITSADDADADPNNEIQTLSLSGSDLTLSNGGGTVTLPAGGGTSAIVTIDNTNYSSVTTATDDIINVRGTVNLSADYNKLDKYGTSISGGKFLGTGTEEISFGRQSVISGVEFENVKIDAHPTTVFVGCKFTNVTDLGWESTFNGCDFYNCTAPTQRVGRITSSELDQCTFNRVLSITNSEIDNSVFGGDYSASPNAYSVGVISNCVIRDSKAYLQRANFTGNTCDGTALYLYRGAFMTITGNKFDDIYTNLNSHIFINMSGSWYTNININGNVFVDNGANPFIEITGSFTGSYNLIKISNNAFQRGSSAVTNNGSNIKLVVTNNALRSVSSLGISNGGNNIVRDNDSF